MVWLPRGLKGWQPLPLDKNINAPQVLSYARSYSQYEFWFFYHLQLNSPRMQCDTVVAPLTRGKSTWLLETLPKFCNTACNPSRTSTLTSMRSTNKLPNSWSTPSPFSRNAFIIEFKDTNVLLRLGSPYKVIAMSPTRNFITNSSQFTCGNPRVANHFISRITSEPPNSNGKKSSIISTLCNFKFTPLHILAP